MTCNHRQHSTVLTATPHINGEGQMLTATDQNLKTKPWQTCLQLEDEPLFQISCMGLLGRCKKFLLIYFSFKSPTDELLAVLEIL